MGAPRRLAVGIGATTTALCLSLAVASYLETRAQARRLVADVARLMSFRLERDGGADLNGFTCAADLLPFPPDAGAVERASWADQLRSCGQARRLAFVPHLSPFRDPASTRPELWSSMVTLLKATRGELDGGVPDENLERCVGTLEVLADGSHLNLIGAMVACSGAEQLVPGCAASALAASTAERERLAARFAHLPLRLAANSEVLETERVLMSATTHEPLLTPRERAQLPANDLVSPTDTPNFAERVILARRWAARDALMRKLITLADVPGTGRTGASSALDDEHSRWWLGEANAPDYEKFLARLDDARVRYLLLADLVAGRRPKLLPASVVLTADELVFHTEGADDVAVHLAPLSLR